jgi:hypothetical protein
VETATDKLGISLDLTTEAIEEHGGNQTSPQRPLRAQRVAEKNLIWPKGRGIIGEKRHDFEALAAQSQKSREEKNFNLV